MKKILFSHSYFLRFDPKQWATGQPYAPLGTLYAASLMRENGFEVSLFDTMFACQPEEVIPHLKSTIKGLKAGLELAESQKGPDETHVVVDYKRKIRAEILLLESYLPQKLSEEELKQIVTNLKVAAGTKTGGALLGFVMGELKKGYPNLYDASLVRSLVETK